MLVLTSFSDGERIVAALDAGAVGYLLKDADPDDVLDGIRAVSRGRVADPPPGRAAAARRPGGAAPGRRRELTPREAEVLALVREGLANKQIARRLGISERTVKAHLTSTFAAHRRHRPHPGRALGRAARALTRRGRASSGRPGEPSSVSEVAGRVGRGPAGSGRSGSGGGVPPNAGQSAWWAHQSHSRLGLGRQSPVSSASRIAAQTASTLRSVASRSSSSGS